MSSINNFGIWDPRRGMLIIGIMAFSANPAIAQVTPNRDLPANIPMFNSCKIKEAFKNYNRRTGESLAIITAANNSPEMKNSTSFAAKKEGLKKLANQGANRISASDDCIICGIENGLFVCYPCPCPC